MQQPSSPRRRTKAAVGLSLATALAATGVTVALAQGDDAPEASDEALEVAEVRYDATPGAQRDAWLTEVGEYAEAETTRRYAVAVYGNLANGHAVGEYADALAAEAAASSYSGSSGNSSLDAIKACESGGDYSAVSSSGTYRGAYQFDQATWEGVGGTGDPAAASPAEQDMRAQMLYEQSGSSPWPVCGS